MSRHLAGLALAAALLPACAGVAASPTAAASPAPRDIVVTEEHWSGGLRVSVGQTFVVRRPVDHEEWNVSYAGDVVRLLTPAARARRPGPDGWRFEAIAPGDTAVTLTGIAPRDGRPNVPQYTLDVHVDRSW